MTLSDGMPSITSDMFLALDAGGRGASLWSIKDPVGSDIDLAISAFK